MKAFVITATQEGGTQTQVVPDSALTRCKDPFFVPDNCPWRATVYRGLRIDRLGKGIEARFADRYYSECITSVHPFPTDVATDPAEEWACDNALTISEPTAATDLDEAARNRFGDLIEKISRRTTLKTGDLILLGSPRESFEIGTPPQNYEIPTQGAFPGLRFKVR